VFYHHCIATLHYSGLFLCNTLGKNTQLHERSQPTILFKLNIESVHLCIALLVSIK